VFVSDRGGAFAERSSRRFGRSLRRYGIADGIRSAGFCHCFIESHYLGGHYLHVDFFVARNFGHAQKFGDRGQCFGQTNNDNACSSETAVETAITTGAGGSEEVNVHLRRWRNWQTH
jgi:hypothetical protein